MFNESLTTRLVRRAFATRAALPRRTIVAGRARHQPALQKRVKAQTRQTNGHQAHTCPALTAVRLVEARTRSVRQRAFMLVVVNVQYVEAALHRLQARAPLDDALR